MRSCALVALVALASPVAAAPLGADIWLSRMCVGESGWHRLDVCAAEVGVRRQREWTPEGWRRVED